MEYLKHQIDNKYSLLPTLSKGIGGKIARALVEDFKEHLNIYNRNKNLINFAVEVFLYNCYQALETQKIRTNIEIVINYSRDKNEYHKIHRYFPYKGWKSFMQVVDTAICLGYVAGQTGFKGETFSKRSYFQPTAKMTHFLNQFNPQDFTNCIKNQIQDNIILKDKTKHMIDYTDTITTNIYRANLELINDVISNHRVTILPGDLPLSSLSSPSISLSPTPTTTLYSRLGITEENQELRHQRLDYNLIGCALENDVYNLAKIASYSRVFNETFIRGGRFYCGLQSLPKEYRRLIKIDGAKTVSLDYSGMHPRMLYNAVGLDMRDGDPYDILPGDISRGTAKRAFLILINAATERSAVLAIKQHLSLSQDMARSIIAAFKAKHKPVAKFICSGEGIKLQYMDSIIAEQIMVYFARKGKVCLGIHDGFIVQRELEAELNDVMREAYYQEMGFYCKISKEY